jgi:hypothetical protein
MLPVQLLDLLSVFRVHWKHPCIAGRASPRPFWARSSKSAVWPAHTVLNTPVSNTHDTAQTAPYLEHFLRLLNTIQVHGGLPDACSALACPPSDPAACVASAQSRIPAESKNEVQHKLSRWPWSVMGKQVGLHCSVFHIQYLGRRVV